MKIIVNAVALSGLQTGIARHLRCLYREMSRLPGVKITYFTGPQRLATMPPLASPEKWIKATSAVWKLPDPVVFFMRCVYWLRYEYLLKREVQNGHYDLYHETAFTPARISGIPVVYNIYDLSLIHFRDKHPRERVWFHDFFLPGRLPYVTRVLTSSEFIKKEIAQTLGVSSSAIDAIPLSQDDFFSRRSASTVSATLTRLRLPEKYFLFVGSLEPRKNLGLIIKAMSLQKDPLPLVMAGWNGWGEKAWVKEIDRFGLKEKVIFAGYVDDDTLAALYSGARGFIYPSLYEGFGLPVLEAMASGCPVICSNAASLPEVAGDAALLVDPHAPADLAAAMERVAQDDAVRRQLIAEGLSRAKEFSWARTAKKTLTVFEKAIAEYRRSTG